ncbi:helix-turn-helix domain-containing protein [Cucumibacter marinus]|uniref:helix-turn-helix domain-containing protein n=1 Tax=Cucumibacter marinus TaxID=1121252 RepID=UPI0003FD5438|nr:helix-turn-helix domain-containing protein [Cucumibacter marinus]
MESTATTIPIFALYGENELDAAPGWLHWETLLSRSRLYDYRIAPHRHDQLFQVLMLSGGEAEVTLDGQSRLVYPPAVIVVPAPIVHGFSFSPDVEGVVVTLFERDVRDALADEPEISAALRGAFVLTERGRALTAVSTEIEALIAESRWQSPGHAAAMRARILLLMVTLHRAVQAEKLAPTLPRDPAMRHTLGFLQKIDQDYREHLPVGDYASALGITAAHLNRVCRQVLGMSAREAIERRVMLEAKRYLMFSPLTVKQIAIVLGYDDPAYFSRVFARATGEAPGRFRDSARG